MKNGRYAVYRLFSENAFIFHENVVYYFQGHAFRFLWMLSSLILMRFSREEEYSG